MKEFQNITSLEEIPTKTNELNMQTSKLSINIKTIKMLKKDIKK